MVEMTGVEPVSRNQPTWLSTSVAL